MFEIFSTLKSPEGELRMSYADFLQTMTPYNHGKLQEKDFIEDVHGRKMSIGYSALVVNINGVL